MNKAQLLNSILLLVLLSFSSNSIKAQSIAQGNQPNVLIIYADDLGYGDIGCYGATKLQTPNIDRLASEGVRFMNAYSPSSTCSQSRYGLLSGRYWWHSKLHPPKGVVAPAGPNVLLEEGITSMPEVFRENGYQTAGFGKWHLGFGTGNFHTDRYDWNQSELIGGPLEVGFDYYFGIAANVSNEPSVYFENRDFVGREEGDQFIIDGDYATAWSQNVVYKENEVAGAVTDKTVAYIKNAETDKPLFLYYSSVIPHKPITPADEYIGTSDCGLYGDFIHELDAQVGMLITALEETGRLGNTLIIFTSDNGAVMATSEEFADQWNLHPMWEAYDAGHRSNGILRAGKHAVYEGGNRIPFIVKWPNNVPSGEISGELFSLTDVFPSLCGLLDMTYPEGNGTDGLEQSALFLSAAAEGFRESMPSKTSNAIAAIRHGKWKMVEHDPNNNTPRQSENTDQLYDLENDPSEQNNIFDNHPDVVANIKTHLDLLMESETVNTDITEDIGPYTSNCTIEFDITPHAYWSDLRIKPPKDDPEYAARMNTYLQFGGKAGGSGQGGTVAIYNPDYSTSPGKIADNFEYNLGTKYNFRITLFFPEKLITVEAKEHNTDEWTVLFDKYKQAHGYPNIGQLVVAPNNLGVTNISSSPGIATRIASNIVKSLKLFPNPVDSHLNITSVANMESVKIYSESGQLKSSMVLTGEDALSLNIADFNAGIYFLHITTNDGDAIKKFIKK
ncbi:sulfatase-like hydrolase/transferase [Carboxylicivirga sp. RSCT41]|uniref:sulfatase-like hydrolase/transferase n=1 Tax=Carboxylicivirga agarovorans TaxID=3417570 RepID=UPI003D329C8A